MVFARIGERLETLAAVELGAETGLLIPFNLKIPTDCRELFFTGGNLLTYQQLHFLFPKENGH